METGKRGRSPGRMTGWFISGLILVIAAIVLIWLLTAKEPAPKEQLFGGSGAEFAGVGMDAPEYDSVDDFVAALAERGTQCSNLRMRPTSDEGQESAECQVSGDDVVIRVFRTNQARNRYLSEVRGLTARADVGGPPGIVGPTWLVVTDTKATANKIKRAVGGESI